jgi:predicted phage tail component-like protein
MITLDGYKLSHFGLIGEKQTNPMTPNFSNKTLSVPGKDGLYNFGTEINEKTLTFNIVAIDKNSNFLQAKLREFARFLVDDYGMPREIKLMYDYEPDKYYLVMLSAPIDPDRVARMGKFTLILTAYDPYAYSAVYADEIRWGSDVITFQSHYKLGHPGSEGLKTITTPTTLNIFTDGFANKPVIEINGSATNLVMSTNGYTINLGTFTNTPWIIDCEAYTVKKNGVNTFLADFRDFILLKGNNQVQISGSGINISIHIKLRDKYS